MHQKSLRNMSAHSLSLTWTIELTSASLYSRGIASSAVHGE